MFDIESCGQYKDWDSLCENDQKGSELFKRKFLKMKWDEKYSDINEAYLENAGVISTWGKICCISFGFIDNNGVKQIRSFYGEDEKDIVEKFNNLLINKIEKSQFKLSGFRILYFDIPFILHKLHKYNIKPAPILYLYDKKPWETRIVDFADDWKCKFSWAYSLDEVAYELEIKSPKEIMNGSQVHDYYWNNRFDDIKTYCEMDVSVSIDLVKKIYNI